MSLCHSKENNSAGTCQDDLFIHVNNLFKKFFEPLFLNVYFLAISDSSIEYGFQRLQKYITRYPGDPDRLSKDTLVKRAADLLEQWYSMSGNPHHFALPTPPSDHEAETSYNNGYANTFEGE